MQTTDERPNPEALLADVAKRRRGKLRLFLGMAPGVGKTYAMLTEARARVKAGLDTLIGWVDTHGRKDTEALLTGLEVLPRLTVRRGHTFVQALDVDEILRRAPAVVVIDEMPHSNPPGSRHAKRWQDIEEILDMGIDVWSAINIQHLESLNDVVARVTGVEVSETVPDRVFDEADEVRLIDLPPDDLIARLNAGKIYLPRVIERARDNYFKKTNLTALRELALRCMASRMETQIRTERQLSRRRSAVEDTSYGTLLVLEYPSQEAVREMARLARSLASPWHVVWLEGFANARADDKEVTELLQFAESLGAVTDVLAGSYAKDVVNYAREHNLSMVAVVGVTARAASAHLAEIRRSAPELNILSLAAQGEIRPTLLQRVSHLLGDMRFTRNGVWQAVISVAVVFLLLIPFQELMDPTNQAMIYLLAVLFCGVRYGNASAAVSAVLAVLAFDFSVVAPRWSFTVNDTQYFITFLVMLIVGFMAGQLVSRSRAAARAANVREHQAKRLYEASTALADAADESDALKIVARAAARDGHAECEFWLPEVATDGSQGSQDTVQFRRAEAVLKAVDPAVVRWCFDHGKEAGCGTQTLVSSPYWYVPMTAADSVCGVAVFRFTDAGAAAQNDPVMRTGLVALVNLAAQTMQRIMAGQQVKQTLVSMEGERLRNSLIQSLSHDLRTPITMLKAGAEGLLSKLRRGQLGDAIEDSEKLLESSSRMQRLVGNILEMAKLQSGGVRLNKSWIPAEDLFGAACAELGDRLKGYDVRTAIDPECPPVYGDEVLLVRVVTNLLDNAVKYCPAGSKIVFSAKRRGDSVAVTVADNGPGLPDGNPQRLFDPFRRGKRETAVSGTGLGLAICRTIARVHGAEIFATDSVWGGAAFTLVLPHVPMAELDDEDAIDDADDVSAAEAGGGSDSALPAGGGK